MLNIDELQSQGCSFRCDEEIGTSVKDFIDKRLPYDGPDGLRLLDVNVLQRTEVRAILTSALQAPVCCFFRGYGYDHRAFNFSHHNSPNLLALQLWRSGSEATFYLGSHETAPRGEISGNRLFEIAKDDLVRPRVKAQRVSFDQGGISIIDARLAFEINKGYVITMLIAEERIVAGFPKMQYLDVESNRLVLLGMETDQIGLNVELVTPQVLDRSSK